MLYKITFFCEKKMKEKSFILKLDSGEGWMGLGSGEKAGEILR